MLLCRDTESVNLLDLKIEDVVDNFLALAEPGEQLTLCKHWGFGSCKKAAGPCEWCYRVEAGDTRMADEIFRDWIEQTNTPDA